MAKRGMAGCILIVLLTAIGCRNDLLINSLPAETVKTGSYTIPTAPEAVNVYLDASLSMKGYLVKDAGSRHDEYVYPILLDEGMVDFEKAKSLRVFKCGTAIQEVPKNQIEQAAQFSRCFGSKCKSFYDTNLEGEPCHKGSRDNGCVNQDSDLVKIFSKIAANPYGITSIITSDLFLSTEKSNGFIGTASKPLQTIFDRGDVIAILAVASRFNGYIYDIFPKQHIEYSGMRPVYMLVTGPKKNVLWILGRMEQRLKSRTGIIWHSALLDPGLGMVETLESVLNNEKAHIGDTVTRVNNLLNSRYSSIPQFQIRDFSPDIKFDLKAQENGGRTIQPHLITAGLKTSLWKHVSGMQNTENDWNELTTHQKIVPVQNGTLTIDISKLTGDLNRKQTYFIDIAVTAKQWEVLATLPGWIDRWNFTAGQFEEIDRKEQDIFPTLNLKRVCQTMADAAFSGEETPIAHIQFAIRRD